VNERGFQLMEQVSGRAGRKNGSGRVMIQTMNPVHPVLQLVAHHDYVGMYQEEIEKRRQFLYPPFTRIIHLSLRHKERDVVNEAAHQFAHALQVPYGKYLVGPAEPVINKVRNLFLMEMLVKLPKDGALIAKCKADILKACADLHADKRFRKVIVVPDVDAL
jgi:primosomal protein N' (replication factor Y) (superfamily II helicase)